MTRKEWAEQMVSMPLSQVIEDVAEKAADAAARKVIAEHIASCPNYQMMKVWRAKLVGVISAVVVGVNILCAFGPWLAGVLWAAVRQ